MAFRHEAGILISAIPPALFWAATLFFLYVALEPYVRRRWPERLIGWSRLVAGNVRDPLVGRDILIGVAAGVAHATIASMGNWLPSHLGLTLPLAPHASNLDMLLGLRYTVAGIGAAISSGIVAGLALTVILVVLAIILRNRALAAIGLYLLQLSAIGFASGRHPYVFASGILIAAIWTAVTVRVGLLGIATAQTIFVVAFQLPISIDASSWMFPAAITPLIFIAVLTAFAFRTALGGQPMFSARLLDE